MDQDKNSTTKQTKPTSSTHGVYRSRVYTSHINVNPLIAACDQLLSLIVTIKDAQPPENSNKLLQDLAHEIHAFEHQAKLASYEPNTIISARYVICSLIDETIQNTGWGKNDWLEKNLLFLFHNEKNGGEKFFTILNTSLEDITNNLHLIELMYICLSFGFIGKYKHSNDNQKELLALTDKLYQIIKQHNHRNPKNILIHDLKAKVILDQDKPTIIPANTDSKKLLGIAIAIAIATSGLIYLGFSLKLNQFSAPIYSSLEQIQKHNSENNL